MSRSSARRALFALVCGSGIAVTSAAIMATPAAADTASCPAPGATSITDTTADSACSASSTTGSAAAAYGLTGTAAANAGPAGLSLAIAQGGGTARSSTSAPLSGPAAIAVGPGATADLSGARPGLALGIAGPGATVTVSGVSTPTCTGGLGFAGDFQTLQGCLSMP